MKLLKLVCRLIAYEVRFRLARRRFNRFISDIERELAKP